MAKDCSISPELQRQLVDYIASYIDVNESKINDVDFLPKMIYELMEEIRHKGGPVSFYSLNAVSMIPFLIDQNFMKRSRGQSNKLYDRYNEKLKPLLGQINNLINAYSDEKNWIENFFDSFAHLDKNIYGKDTLIRMYISGGKDSQRHLDIERMKLFRKYFVFKPRIKSPKIQGTVIYRDSKNNVLVEGKAQTIISNGQNITTIDGAVVSRVDGFNESEQIVDDIKLSKDDVQEFTQTGQNLFKVVLTPFSSYSDITAEPQTKLVAGTNGNYQFFLNFKIGNTKIGVIRHTTVDSEGNRVSESSELEKKIIDAYLLSNGNLYMRRNIDGSFTIFSPKYTYNSDFKERVEEQNGNKKSSKKTTETPKKENKIPQNKKGSLVSTVQEPQPAPVKTTDVTSLITLPYLLRQVLNPSRVGRDKRPNDYDSIRNHAVYDEQINSQFASILSESLAQGKELEIDGKKVIFTLTKGTLVPQVTQFRNPDYNRPLVLTACDTEGKILKFSISEETDKLILDENGSMVAFDMFAAYFSDFHFNDTAEEKQQKIANLKEELIKYGIEEAQANYICSNLGNILLELTNLNKAVNNGEKIYFDAKGIAVPTKMSNTESKKITKNDIGHINFIEDERKFYITKKVGPNTIRLQLKSNYNEEQAKALEQLLLGEYDHNLRMQTIKSLFRPDKNGDIHIGDYTIRVGSNTLYDGELPVVTYHPDGTVSIVPYEIKTKADVLREKLHERTQFGNKIQLTPDLNKAKNDKFLTPWSQEPVSFEELPFEKNNVESLIDPVIVVERTSLNPIEEQNEDLEVIDADQTETNQGEEKIPDAANDVPISFSNDYTDETDGSLDKSLFKKLENDPVTAEQIRQAKEWYATSPLKEIISVDEMYHIVSRTSVANFKGNVITLMSGSDYTDVYHEAWHSFSQLFLSLEEKTNLYKSVKKKKGSFTDYEGKKVKFSEANFKQIEEYLAEEFRTYMLDENKSKQYGWIRKAFKKLKDILYKITYGSFAPEVYFEKLKIGDISDYTADRSNVMFKSLDKSIITKDGSSALSMRDSYDLKNLVDNYITEFQPVDSQYRNQKTKLEFKYLYEALDIISNSQRRKDFDRNVFEDVLKKNVNEKYTALSVENRNTIINYTMQLFDNINKSRSNDDISISIDNASEFLSSPLRIRHAYSYSKIRLMMRKIEIQDRWRSKDLDEVDKVRFSAMLRTVQNGLDNFGEIKKLDKGKSGLVKYHYDRYFNNLEFAEEDEETDTEDEDSPKFNEFDDNKCNARSAEQRIGNNAVLKFILSTIPAYELKKVNGEYKYVPVTDILSEQSVKNFKHIKNRLTVLLQGCVSPEEAYERLQYDAYETTYNKKGQRILAHDDKGNYIVHNPMTAYIIKRLGDMRQNMSDTDRKTMRKNLTWIQFHQVFSAPEVHSIEAGINVTTSYLRDEEGKIVYTDEGDESVPVMETKPVIVSNEMNGPLWKMDDHYRRNFKKVGYTKNSKSGIALDVDRILDEFENVDEDDKRDKFPELVRACGLALTLDPKCIDKLTVDAIEDVNNAYDIIIANLKAAQKNNSLIIDVVNEFWKKYISGNTNLRDLYDTIKQVDMGYTEGINTEMIKNAEGKVMFMNQMNNSMTVVCNHLRRCKNYGDVLNDPVLRHLDIRKYLSTGEYHSGRDGSLPVVEVNPRYNPNCAGDIHLRELFCIANEEEWYETIDAYVKLPNGKYRKQKVKIYIPQNMIKSDFELSLINLSGMKVKNQDREKGQTLFSADKYTKTVSDYIHAANGLMEVMRHADNGVSYAFQLHDSGKNYMYFNDDSNNGTNWFNINDQNTFAVPGTVRAEIKEGILHQMERILLVKKYKKDAEDDNFMYDRKYLNGKNVDKTLGVYDDMLTKQTKDMLEAFMSGKDYASVIEFDPINDKQLLKAINKDIDSYFYKVIRRNRAVLDTALKNLFVGNTQLNTDAIKIIFERFGMKSISIKDADQIDVEQLKDAMAAYYTYNNTLYNISCIQTIYGDVMVFNHDKDEFTKRIKGMGSSGKIPVNDKYTNETIRKMCSAKDPENPEASGTISYFNTLKGHEYEANPLLDDLDKGTIRTAVCSDIFPVSAYAETYKNISKKYGYIEEESNAQGLMSFDAYRIMSIRLGKWSDAKENLFQKIISGEEVSENDTATFFPVLKLQFNGPLDTGLMPLNAFHKYSLLPIIPTMVKDKNLEIVHKKMLEEGISYITFNSGSKEACISKNDTIRQGEYNGVKNEQFKKVYDGQYGDKLYDPNSLDIQNRLTVDDDGNNTVVPRQLNQALMSDEPFFTPNVIPLEFIKDQVEIHDTLDLSTIFATQMRRLMCNNLMVDGYPADIEENQRNAFDNMTEEEKEAASPCYAKMKRYLNSISGLTQNAIKNIRTKFGFNEKTGKFNENKFFEFVKKELVKKNIPEYAIENISTIEQLQFGPFRDEVEKIIVSFINKNVIRQHIHGGMYVQAAGTLFEDLKNPSFGTNDLAYYGMSNYQEYDKNKIKVVKPGETEPATIKLPLAGDFAKLLYANHIDGEKIGSLDRLNQCLRDNKWVNEHIEALTVVACRIPVQGYNSIENLRISEFLAPGCNNIVVCPSETVIKSGSDYDVDKLSMVTPHIKLIGGEVYIPKKGRTKSTDEKEVIELKKQRNNLYGKVETNIIKKLNDIKKYYPTDKAKFNAADKYISGINNILDKIDDLEDSIKQAQEGLDVASADDSNIASMTGEIYNLYNSLTSLFRDIISDVNFTTEAVEKGTGVTFKGVSEQIDKYDEICKKLSQDKFLRNKLDNSKAGLENECLESMSEIMKMPIVYNSLLTPNQTDKFTGKDKPATVLSEHATYNRFLNFNNEEYKEEDEKGNIKRHMSPTRVIEAEYNLDKHDNLNTGKTILGPTAIDNVFAPIAKAVGIKMSKCTMEVRDYVATDKDGKEIVVLKKSEIEEILKDPRKRLKIYGRVSDRIENNSIEDNSILRQISSFQVQKLYLPHNNENGEIVLGKKYDASGKDEISDSLSQLINGCVDVAKDAWITYIEGNTEAWPTVLFMFQAGIPVDYVCYFVSNPLIVDYINKKISYNSSLSILNDQDRINIETKARAEMLGIDTNGVKQSTLKGKILTATDKLMNKLEGKQFKVDRLEHIAKVKDRKNSKEVLAHFFQIEDMAKSVNSLKLAIRVDGSKANKLYDILNRQNSLKKSENDPRLDVKSVSKIRTHSVMSSFFVEDLVQNIVGTVLPEKTDEYLTDRFHHVENDTMETADLFDRFFGDFPSYLYQNMRKSAYDKSLFKADGSFIDSIQNIVNKATNNGEIAIFDIPQRIRGAFAIEVNKRIPMKDDILKSQVFKNWVLQHKEYDEIVFETSDDEESNKINKDILEESVAEFIYYDSLQAVGYGEILNNTNAGYAVNPYSVVSKYMLVQSLIYPNEENSENYSNAQRKRLATFFSDLIFFNKIQPVTYNDGRTGLVFDTEMDDDQKAIVFEEYNKLIAGDGGLNEALKGLSKYDRQYIIDFLNDLPYFSLVQSGISASSSSLCCMFDYSKQMSELYEEFTKMEKKDKSAVVNDYINQFNNNLVLKSKSYADEYVNAPENNDIDSIDFSGMENETDRQTENGSTEETTSNTTNSDMFGNDPVLDIEQNEADDSDDSCRLN